MLPGGTWDSAFRVNQTFRFAEITGKIELDLAESLPAMGSAADQVTAVLTLALAELGGEKAEVESVHHHLSIGDRQYLMRLFARRLGLSHRWHSVKCLGCGELFDIEVDPADLPVKEATAPYPLAVVSTSAGPLRIRIPTGADQGFLRRSGDGPEALRNLVKQLLLVGENADPDLLTVEDISKIEQGIEAVSPEVTCIVETRCPECKKENRVFMDPYDCIPKLVRCDILQEVHLIACAYHWPESQILDLPRHRRRAYLELIDKGSQYHKLTAPSAFQR